MQYKYHRRQPIRNYDNRLKPLMPSHRTRLTNTLYLYRNQIGMTQDELAEKSGVSRRTIHAIETHKQWPTLVVALKLAAAVDVDITRLFKLRENICCLMHLPDAMKESKHDI